MDPNSSKNILEAEGQWSSGLYDCWDDRSNCLITAFCPCITMGEMVEIIDKGTTSSRLGCILSYAMASVHCGWLYGSSYRSKLRHLFSLPESPYSDLFVHCCCCVCGTCQEYRELKNRGVDPSIGWQGNVDKWKREGVTEPPIVVPTMARTPTLEQPSPPPPPPPPPLSI